MSMSKSYVCDTKFDNTLLFRLSSIKEIQDIFNAEISHRENMGKTINKYITALDYTAKTLIVLSVVSSSVSFDHSSLSLVQQQG